MRKSIIRFSSISMLIIAIMSFFTISACTSAKTSTTTTPAPTITITSPNAGMIPQIGDVTITVQVANFDLEAKYGQANVTGQGHIHYFMDVAPPTTPGKAAVTTAGTWTNTTDTSYTWHNVGGGPHTFSVELVNNDHTPLVPPVTNTVNVNVLPEIGPPAVAILTPRDGADVTGNSVTIDIQTANFNIVDKQGQPAVDHEGHVHFFMDVNPIPTTAGQPAVPTSGTWAHVSASTYTFTNISPGTHTFAVELVNNDHTPLVPPVVATITITIQPFSSTTSGSTTSTSVSY